MKPTRPLGKRIDGDYLHRSHPMRRWRRVLMWGAAVIAVAWFAMTGLTKDGERFRMVGTLYNPGPVSSAHAYFEHNCTMCHTGSDGGGFMRGVTDAACLKCHDGAVHHANQRVADTRGDVSRSDLKLAITNPDHPLEMHSAGCVTCHVEHRGQPALTAMSDQHCVMCHQDVSAAAAHPIHIENRVTAFDSNRHPAFGRALREDNAWVDRTSLKFNHLAHKNKEPALLDGTGELNCALCHTTQEPPSLSQDRGKQPPYATLKDRPRPAANSSDRRYMQPVRFDRHCATCHQEELKLPTTVSRVKVGRRELKLRDRVGGEPLAHRELAVVREQINSRLAALAGKAALDAEKGQIPREQWVEENINMFARQIEGNFERELSAAYIDRKLERPQTPEEMESLLLDYYEAYVAFTSCAKCHAIEGDLPAPQPAEKRQPLSTVSTGIPSAPRRWFAASQFDHDAHRNLGCIDCHAGASTSAVTSDLLLPDMTTKGGFSGAACVDCHNPNPSGVRTAPAGCVTCHLYHDRTLERPIHGKPAAAP